MMETAFPELYKGSLATDAGFSHSGSWGDYDNDSDWDLFVANDGQKTFFIRIMAMAHSRKEAYSVGGKLLMT